MNIFKRFCLTAYLILGLGNTALAGEFDQIDLKVLSLDRQTFPTLAKLSQTLATFGHTDREKARAVFTWIAHNIAYDYQSFNQGIQPDGTAENVFRTRRAVCDGYANLFVAMARQTGLSAEYIIGYAKNGLGTSNNYKDIYHSWNAVKVEGKWQLLDATWGAGYLDTSKKFVRKFNSHYFLPDPTQMAVDHFPLTPQWQLLQRPLTEADFAKLPDIGPAFFAFGVNLPGFSSSTIPVNQGWLQISASSQTDSILKATLTDAQGKELENRILMQFIENKSMIQAVIPKAGEYNLNIFAGLRGQKSLAHAISYRVVSSQINSNNLAFPTMYSDYLDRHVQLISPLTGTLAHARPTRFQLRVPGANKVAVIFDNKWSELVLQSEIFTGTVNLDGLSNKAFVCAEFPGSNGCHYLVDYQISY